MNSYIPVPTDHCTFWPNLIKTLRRERHLSQRQLSESARVPRNTLRKIEAGETAPSVHTLERLLAVMGHEIEVMQIGALLES